MRWVQWVQWVQWVHGFRLWWRRAAPVTLQISRAAHPGEGHQHDQSEDGGEPITYHAFEGLERLDCIATTRRFTFAFAHGQAGSRRVHGEPERALKGETLDPGGVKLFAIDN